MTSDSVNPEPVDAVVIGGGAAGFFAAIRAAELGRRVILLEATRRTLTKVRISGGGRCNVTHRCFTPAELVRNYPRGQKELLGAFTRFQPKDTIHWFEQRGVKLKVESDGRMFPVTDDSETIATCLEQAAERAKVDVRLGSAVSAIERRSEGHWPFVLTLKSGAQIQSRGVLLASGSAPAGHALAQSLGHSITPLAPSLFTFQIRDPRLHGLAGVTFEKAHLTLKTEGDGEVLTEAGPLLVTHWGLSGPAVLKLSAFGARSLQQAGYQAELRIHFLTPLRADAALRELRLFRAANGKKSVARHAPWAGIPRRFWTRLVELVGLNENDVYADLNKNAMQMLSQELTNAKYSVQGKGLFKDEFVTAGGVSLKEVDFRSLESRLCPQLFFAGEVLDVDGITGGFNFQAAWTTAYLAAESLGGVVD